MKLPNVAFSTNEPFQICQFKFYIFSSVQDESGSSPSVYLKQRFDRSCRKNHVDEDDIDSKDQKENNMTKLVEEQNIPTNVVSPELPFRRRSTSGASLSSSFYKMLPSISKTHAVISNK